MHCNFTVTEPYIPNQAPRERGIGTGVAREGAVGRLAACLAALALVASLLLFASSAHATDQHVFDAALSLTGDCSTSSVDEVPDPGCPGGSHPPRAFNDVCGVATDRLGYIYVASSGTPYKHEARIDVFDPKGFFITEIAGTEGGKDVVAEQSCRPDVDSAGRIYVAPRAEGEGVTRYTPSVYPPVKGVTYSKEAFVAAGRRDGVAIDPTNNHVYVAASSIHEYKPNGELVKEFGGFFNDDVAVWDCGGHPYVYSSVATGAFGSERQIQIYDGATGALLNTIENVSQDTSLSPYNAIAVDHANGDVYTIDFDNKRVSQFRAFSACGVPIPGGEKVGAIAESYFQEAVDTSDLVLDGSQESPNQGYLFVGSGREAGAHVFVFKPLEAGPPIVSGQAAAQITTTAATLEGKVTPHGAATTYLFQYVDEADYQVNGWAGGTSIEGAGEIAGEAPATAVSAPIAGLAPGTTYRFRIVATNHCESDPEVKCVTEGERNGAEEVQRSFATYPEAAVMPSCLNAAFRSGSSASLPDCRAYELVTPPATGAFKPIWYAEVSELDTPLATPNGGSLLVGSENHALPGIVGNGVIDVYETLRGPRGWATQSVGPSGAQARYPEPISASPDHGYVLWKVYGTYGGALAIDGGQDRYLRRPEGVENPECSPEPEGQFELIGCAEPGFKNEPEIRVRWITAGAGHIIFDTSERSHSQLRADAPPSGTPAIYDRTPDGLHTVSLEPGNVTPNTYAYYQGASADGTTVLFSLGSDTGSTPLYARIDNAKTVEVASAGWTFAGVSGNGTRVFYLQGGDLFACDLGAVGCVGSGANAPAQIGSGGETTVVNVSANGSYVYFVSSVVLTGHEKNEHEEEAGIGKENLYGWDGSGVRFIATLDPVDVAGVSAPDGSTYHGLGLWVPKATEPNNAARHEGAAADPSRSTPDGSALVFESHASLTGYKNEGHTEIYRYDAAANSGAGELACLSCNPTKAPASSDARLENFPLVDDFFSPASRRAPIANLSEDGRTVFFESADRLVSGDTDGLPDVYEWEAHGVGGCEQEGGCLSLISSGHSSTPNYLYAVSADGRDVFIRTTDSLLAQDTDGGAPSIYDARMGGGFAEPPVAKPCEADACQGPPASAPLGTLPSSALFFGQNGNVVAQPAAKPKAKPKPKRCRKGSLRKRVHGKLRCVKQKPRARRGARRAR